MRYIKLGSTGLEISPIALGAMTYGEPGRGYPAWSLREEDSRPLIKHALEAGINFFDTANMYSLGSSEEILGRALKDYANRDDVVICTKVRLTMRPGPNGQGLSRKAIMAEIDHSLRRLSTDYVDIYMIHRTDNQTPVEETLEALHDVVTAGKARYLGASSMRAFEFAKALHLQRQHGWARFITMQDHYNLLAREEEREMLPLCADEGVGTMVWSPLARGRLAAPGRPRPPIVPNRTPSPSCSTPTGRPMQTAPSSTPLARSPRPVAFPAPLSPWRGYTTTRWWRHRSSAPTRPDRSTTPSPHSISNSPMTKFSDSRVRTPRAVTSRASTTTRPVCSARESSSQACMRREPRCVSCVRC